MNKYSSTGSDKSINFVMLPISVTIQKIILYNTIVELLILLETEDTF